MRGDLRRALGLVRRRTFRGPPLRVVLYEKAGCHLCDEAYRALRRIGLDRPLEIERVRTDEERYVLRVPVLAVGGEELEAAGLEDGAIARWLQAVTLGARS